MKRNCHNYRFCSDANLRITVQQLMHSLRAIVWFGFWESAVLGSYVFQNAIGNAVTVNWERYQNMLREYFWPELDGIDTKQVVPTIWRYLPYCARSLCVIAGEISEVYRFTPGRSELSAKIKRHDIALFLHTFWVTVYVRKSIHSKSVLLLFGNS